MDIDAELALAERFTAMAQHELARCASDLEMLGWPLPQYDVEWSTRGRVAGWCCYPRAGQPRLLLKFNGWLAAREGEAFRETVAHEYAHAAVWAKYGRHISRAHGWEFQQIMQIFGYAGNRCHRYATISAAAQRRA